MTGTSTLDLHITPKNPDRRPIIAQLAAAQIGNDYKQIAQKLAGPFWERIAMIFPDEYLAVYVLTDAHRRHVWHATLVGLSQPDPTGTLIYARELFQQHLLERSNHDLIQIGYGCVPRGYLNALKKLNLFEPDPDTYLLLHQVIQNPILGQAISRLGQIDLSRLQVIEALGEELCLGRLPEIIQNPSQARGLHEAVHELVRVGPITREQMHEHLARVRQPRHLGNVLQRAFSKVPFPEPSIQLGPTWIPIRTRYELLNVARRFKNCVAHFEDDAFRLECCFWERPGDEPALVQLCNDGAFGWYMGQLQGIENQGLSEPLKQLIHAELTEVGVTRTDSIHHVLGRMSSRRMAMERLG